MSSEVKAEDRYRKMWTDLGMNLKLHDQLLDSIDRSHRKTHLNRTRRPAAMAMFDQALHDSHAARVESIVEYRRAGGRSIGTFCIYIPDEIAIAAGVLPIPLCGGSGFTVDFADRMFPRDICPLVRSTFGMAFSGTCPYKTLKEYPLGETTCDAKKKAWDLLGIPSLELPQKKNPVDRELWLSEVRRFAGEMEKLSGRPVEAGSLGDAIRLVNRRRRLLQSVNEHMKLFEPPISGLDALLVSQSALSMDIGSFITACTGLLRELDSRAAAGASAYDAPGPRVLIAGSPSPMGYSKVHHVAESSGFRVVHDESCTGSRYYRDLVDEGPRDIEGMLEAVADRYFRIDCACFSPNTERLDNVLEAVSAWRIDAVIHGVLQYCHAYDIEARALDRVLAKAGVPALKIVTDYSELDTEQIRVRVEAFREMVDAGSPAGSPAGS